MPDLIVGTNTYVTLATADAHFAARLHADTWDAASDDTKERALLMAALLLDRHILWLGTKADPEQAMEWPRVGVDWLPAVQVPQAVMVAQMELALLLLTQDTTALPDTAGLKTIQADTLKIEVNAADRVKSIPDSIFALIRVYGSRAGGLSTIKLVR